MLYLIEDVPHTNKDSGQYEAIQCNTTIQSSKQLKAKINVHKGRIYISSFFGQVIKSFLLNGIQQVKLVTVVFSVTLGCYC